MYVTTLHNRMPAATAVLAAGWLVLAVPAAAAPIPVPQSAGVTGCPIDVHDFVAQLRADGFTAQAANIATQLTNRDCLTRR